MTTEAPDTAVTLTTYKRADKEPFGGDYSWATDIESVESEVEDADRPLEVIEEVWERRSVRRIIAFPTAYTCEVEDAEPCEEDAAGWWQSSDGVWLQACAQHGGVDMQFHPDPRTHVTSRKGADERS